MGLLLNDPFIQGKTLHFWQLHNFSSILIFKDQILLHINVSNYLNCIVSQYNFYLLVKNPILERDHLELIKKRGQNILGLFLLVGGEGKMSITVYFHNIRHHHHFYTTTTSTPPPLLHHHHHYTITTTNTTNSNNTNPSSPTIPTMKKG